MKKLLVIFLALAMLLAFAACGEPEAPPAEPAAPAEPAEPAEADGKAAFKLGVLIDQTITDGGWDQTHWAGILGAFEALGLDTETQLQYVEGASTTGGEAESVIATMIDDGCNAILGVSSTYQATIEGVMGQYPDVTFMMFEGTAEAPNYITFSVADSDAIFLLGYASALLSGDQNELGFVAAQPQASVIRAINAFTEGALYANPEANVNVAWVNSWYAPDYEAELVQALYDEGVTMIGYHGSTSSVATTCESLGIHCTGFHLDMEDYAPAAVIGSFCWNWAPIYEEAFSRIIANLDGGELNTDFIYLGIKEGCATVAPWNEGILSQEIIDSVNDAQSKIESGEVLCYPAPLNDNQGNVLLNEGESFTDQQLMQTYFLVEGINGELP